MYAVTSVTLLNNIWIIIEQNYAHVSRQPATADVSHNASANDASHSSQGAADNYYAVKYCVTMLYHLYRISCLGFNGSLCLDSCVVGQSSAWSVTQGARF